MKYKKSGSLVLAITFLLTAVPVFAQSTDIQADSRVEQREIIDAEKREFRSELKARQLERGEKRDEVKIKRENTLEKRDGNRVGELKARVGERLEENGDRRDELKERAGERLEKRETRRAEVSAKFSEKAKIRIEGYLGRMTRRMGAMADRLDKIAGRLEERLEIIEDSGEDVALARNALDVAKLAIDDAREDITRLKELGNELISSIEFTIGSGTGEEATSPGTVLRELKDLAVSARDALKSAHASLVDAIKIIRGMNLSASVLNAIN